MRTVFLILATLVFIFCKGQSIYLPYNIQRAYDNNTRSKSGKPGENYFQNKAKYDIKAAFDPKSGILKGKERVTYYNNSPDSMYYFVIRLYQDILKKGNLRDDEIPAEYLTNGVEINSFKINNEEYIGNPNNYFKRIGTNLTVGINFYSLPGDSVIFDIEWKTIYPPGHVHRFGKYGNGNWFIAYWYPQIAVYDDIDGWDTHNYTGRQEFYNDINDFNVEISLPSGYLSWATGNWLNAKDILSTQVYERYQKAKVSDDPISIVSQSDWKKKQVLVKKKNIVYNYSVNRVPDFAFAISNNYNWNAASTIVDSTLGNRSVVHSVFPVSADEFKNLAEKGAKSINHFSHFSLKTPYPYTNITLFCGDGGMEFPMMVNMGNKTSVENIFVAMHELFHSYFPFYTGLNERKYGWLDEGLTSFLPIETEAVINEPMNSPLSRYIEIYNSYSGSDQESPLFMPTVQTRGRNFYHQSYYRSTAAFSQLEQYLGQETFRAAINSFIKIWKYKHPTGYDFIFSLNNYIEEDINWLIEPWFFGFGWADLSIDTVTQNKKGFDIAIKNIGGMPVPVYLKIIPVKGESYFIKRKADVWKEQQQIIIHISDEEQLKRIELGDINIPDKVSANNYFFFKDSSAEKMLE